MQSSSILARSCGACRRRKIRCTRRSPGCAYCVKMGLTCEYPTSRRHGRQDHRSVQAMRQSAPPLSPSATATALPASSTPDQPSHALPSPLPREPFWARVNSYATSLEDQDGGYGVAEGSSNYLPLMAHQDNSMSGTDQCRPSAVDAFRLWQIYIDNVDPLIKIIHTPTVQIRLLETISHPECLDANFEALLFAIYYAAMISMLTADSGSGDSCREETARLATYRSGLNQALVNAAFVESRDIITLQAFVIYLVCARFDSHGIDTWALISLAIRIGMRLRLHQESPTSSGVSPYDEQLRRRLWWQICILDIRIAEDAGTDPMLSEHLLNVPMPASIHDVELYPEMSRTPVVVQTGHAMFYNNLRIDVSRRLRPILFDSNSSTLHGDTLQQRIQAIDELQQRLEKQYFRRCDLQIPLCSFAVSTVKLVLTKGRLGLYITAGPAMEGWCDQTEDNIFCASVEMLEQTQFLITHTSYARWWWLVRTYIEWDALVLVLRGLCRNPSHIIAPRAWKAVEKVFSSAGLVNEASSHKQRWICLCRLKARAEAYRDNGTHDNDNSWCLNDLPTNVDFGLLVPEIIAEETLPMELPPALQDWSRVFDGNFRLGPSWFEDKELRSLFEPSNWDSS